MSEHPSKKASESIDGRRWRTLVRRDASAGNFYYAVRTTGIYCRPGCASRLPRRKNVSFYRTRADAERAGYRACKRCQPDATSPALERARSVVRACELLDRDDAPATLRELADAVGYAPHHFQRMFRQLVGITPKQYSLARKSERLKRKLAARSSVTDAFYDAGFNASSRFYEKADAMLGMHPTAYKRGGSGVAVRFVIARCSLGLVLVATTSRGICAVQLGDSKGRLEAELFARFPEATISKGDSQLRALVKRVAAHIDEPRSALAVPLDVRGTAFQHRVWQALRKVKLGRTASYGEIAHGIGQPTAARAVARACAQNPIAVLVPCHRVLRGDGDISGYRWGVERKRALLEREAQRKIPNP
jgi:AraC family transcriptional regulator of adaptative response/methylated-DNA-[protein]-cysteine methyltransferase